MNKISAAQAVEAVIAREIDRISKVNLNGQRDVLIQALKELLNKTCSVCFLPGHNRSYCWLNAQMYAALRDHDEAHVAWAYAKKHAGMVQRQAHHKAVGDALAKHEEEKLASSLGVLRKRLHKKKV